MSRSVPRPHPPEIGGVLLSANRLRRRVAQLGRAISAEQGGRELVILALLSGSVLFLADLIRQLDLPLQIDFLGVSSYRNGTEEGDLEFTGGLKLDLRGRDVLVVDDILDSGQTLAAVIERLQTCRPHRLRTCVLLDKPSGRRRRVEADYVGFRVPDYFVVGYGLDHAERYRNLPYIGVLRPAAVKGGA